MQLQIRIADCHFLIGFCRFQITLCGVIIIFLCIGIQTRIRFTNIIFRKLRRIQRKLLQLNGQILFQCRVEILLHRQTQLIRRIGNVIDIFKTGICLFTHQVIQLDVKLLHACLQQCHIILRLLCRNLQLIQVILAQKTQTVLFLPLFIQLFLDFSVFLCQRQGILITLDGGKIGFYGNLQTKVLQILADSCLLFALLCLINGRNNLLPAVIHPFFIFHIWHSNRAACASVDVIQRIIQIIQGILNFSQVGAMLFRLRQCFLCGQLRQLQCRLLLLCQLLHRCHLHALLRRGKSLSRKHRHTLRPADAHRKGQRQCAFCLI